MMKKKLILAAALPLVFGGVGFGAGTVLPAPKAPPMPEELAEAPPAPPDPLVTALDAAEQAPPPAAAKDGKVERAAAHVAPTHGAEDEPVLAEPVPAPKPLPKQIVKLGRMTIPVYKPKSVTYVVADFGVAVKDAGTDYVIGENAAKLRAAILDAMMKAAEEPSLRGVKIDSDALAENIRAGLKPEFADVEEVLFLTLFKQDMPRG